MSGRYDQIKNDMAFRKDVANRCGAGFDVLASLASIEPNNLKSKLWLNKKLLYLFDWVEEEWSGRKDLNLRPPGPEPGI